MQKNIPPAEHRLHGAKPNAGSFASFNSHDSFGGVQKVHGKPHRSSMERRTSLEKRSSLDTHHHHRRGSIDEHRMEVSPDMVESIRSQLPEEFKSVEDDLIKMFIRATGANMALSTKRLIATLEWRKAKRPAEIVCTRCQTHPRSHYMHVVGYDLHRRPIIYSCNGMASNRDFQDNWNHMIQSFEMAIKCMPPGVEQWIWILDFHGFALADVSTKLAKAFLDVAGEHYPERLGYFMVLDAPSVFSLLWRAIEMFIDKKTLQKIAWKSCDLDKPGDKSKLRVELARRVDPTTQAWLEQEILNNRSKSKVAANKYDYATVYEQCKDGTPPPPSGDHNYHGTQELLEHFAQHPQSLLPQAVPQAAPEAAPRQGKDK